MLTSLTTKLALKKVGLPSNTFDFSGSSWTGGSARGSKTDGVLPGLDDMTGGGSSNRDSTGGAVQWPAWMTVKSLPLTVQPWLAPPPPPIPVATECPKIGDLAPLDRDRKLTVGGGRKVVVVFLRCVGCAFAQKLFLALRALATRYPPSQLTCIAVSHSSPRATQKWLDLLGGPWAVQVVVDEDRAVYAAWGLGVGSYWAVLNPATQAAAWKEKGWLGVEVAGAITRTWGGDSRRSARVVAAPKPQEADEGGDGRRPVPPTMLTTTGGSGVVGDAADDRGPLTVMGNKWQMGGAWAVDGQGKIVWGRACKTADEILDLDEGLAALGLGKN